MARIHRRTVKEGLSDPDNQDDVVTHVEPDILECEVKWAWWIITMNKASGGDGIPADLFQILKDDVVEVLHSICQQIWKTQQWPLLDQLSTTGWEMGDAELKKNKDRIARKMGLGDSRRWGSRALLTDSTRVESPLCKINLLGGECASALPNSVKNKIHPGYSPIYSQ